VPTAHGVHIVAPAALYVPAAHVEHVRCLVEVWNLPAAHGVQVPAPAALYVPAEQSVQLAPAALYVPAMQAVQLAAPAALCLPTAHGVQFVAPAALYVPAAHVEQAVLLGEVCKEPAGHCAEMPPVHMCPGGQGTHCCPVA
jgi:hypothetical protein